MKNNSQYVKCPRCELNYIPKGEELCDVCKAELKLIQRSPLIPDEEDEMLCPYCKENYISIDDEMCLKCMERFGEVDKVIEPDVEEDEADWDEYIDEKIPEDEDIVSLTGLEEEENALYGDEEEDFEDSDFDSDEDFDDEDFDDVDFDDYDDDDDEDEDEDFDEDDL